MSCYVICGDRLWTDIFIFIYIYMEGLEIAKLSSNGKPSQSGLALFITIEQSPTQKLHIIHSVLLFSDW